MRTTKEEREEQREALREGGWVNDASTDRPAVVDVDFVDQADALYALLDDVDAVTTTLTTIATAAGLPADASAEEVVKRVGEMRGALIAIGRYDEADRKRATAHAYGHHAEAVDLARRLAEEAGRG